MRRLQHQLAPVLPTSGPVLLSVGSSWLWGKSGRLVVECVGLFECICTIGTIDLHFFAVDLPTE